MLGPLLNPAGAVYGLIGVYSPDISMLMAQALQQLGTRKALVVHSQVTPIPERCFDSSSCVPSHIMHVPHLLVDAWPCMLGCTVIKLHSNRLHKLASVRPVSSPHEWFVAPKGDANVKRIQDAAGPQC